MSRWIVRTLIILFLATLVPLSMIARDRGRSSGSPRISVIWDMDQMPSFGSQSENPLFEDGRSMRPRIEGTVARGDLEGSEAFRLGKESGDWVKGFPLPVEQDLLERGQERYGIFCAPCHGYSGYGDGMVARRALELQEPKWVPPTDLHTEIVVKRSEGELYHTIDRGIRNMPAYGKQISVKDRWAIVAWIRVLQRSQNARLQDLPAEERATLR